MCQNNVYVGASLKALVYRASVSIYPQAKRACMDALQTWLHFKNHRGIQAAGPGRQQSCMSREYSVRGSTTPAISSSTVCASCLKRCTWGTLHPVPPARARCSLHQRDPSSIETALMWYSMKSFFYISIFLERVILLHIYFLFTRTRSSNSYPNVLTESTRTLCL